MSFFVQNATYRTAAILGPPTCPCVFASVGAFPMLTLTLMLILFLALWRMHCMHITVHTSIYINPTRPSAYVSVCIVCTLSICYCTHIDIHIHTMYVDSFCW